MNTKKITMGHIIGMNANNNHGINANNNRGINSRLYGDMARAVENAVKKGRRSKVASVLYEFAAANPQDGDEVTTLFEKSIARLRVDDAPMVHRMPGDLAEAASIVREAMAREAAAQKRYDDLRKIVESGTHVHPETLKKIVVLEADVTLMTIARERLEADLAAANLRVEEVTAAMDASSARYQAEIAALKQQLAEK